MGAITDTFEISADEFWSAAQRLHELEVVDTYENEIIRVSDQVLSTYLFYLAVFREKVLDFSVLLDNFFPRFRSQLIDSLNPVLVAFDAGMIREGLRPHVDRAWRLLQERGDEDGLLNLIDVFWFVKQTDALIYLGDKISLLDPNPRPISELQFTMGSNVPPTASILGILDNFRNAEEPASRAAVSLILDYLEKRPAELSLVLRMLIERYGITHLSYLDGFAVERNAADVIWEKTREGVDELTSRVFLAVAEPLLHTHFTTHEPKAKLSISIIQFDVPVTPELLEFRHTLWGRVFSLYQRPALQEPVLKLIQTHSHSGFLVKNKEIITQDAANLQPFLGAVLDPSKYGDCVIVHDYLELLDWLEIEGDEQLRTRFTNDIYALSELLFDDRKERRDLGWEEYDLVRQQRLAEHTAGFGLTDFDTFFDRCVEILRASDRSTYEAQIQDRVVDVLRQLAGRDASMFDTVLSHHLHSGNSLNLGPWWLAPTLVQVCGPDRAYEIISGGDYPQKVSWFFGYFMALPPEAATAERLQLLYELYETASWREQLRGMDYLLKFTSVDLTILIRVTRILVSRAGTEPGFGYALSDLFSEHSELKGKLQEIFAGDVGLLKEAYFYACEAEHHTDYYGKAFNTLLDLDPNFAREWVARMFANKEWVSRRDDSRNYMFLWRRDDHRVVIERVIEAVHIEGRGKFNTESYIENFFALHDGVKDAQMICDRQDAFFDEMIERRHSDAEFMRTLFSIIRNLHYDRRRGRIAAFISHNTNFEAFEALPLGTSYGSWTGSAVPMLQRRLDYFESLLPILNTVKLLRHKQRVEHIVQYLREDIEREKRRDFMGH